MENTTDKDDEEWLSALAGRTGPAGNTRSNAQASVLRRALQLRAQTLEAKVPFADEGQYQALVARLQREKLIAAKTGWRNSPLWVKTTGALGMSADVIPWKSPMVLGLAATMMIAGAVFMSMQRTDATRSDMEVLRSGAVTTQIVQDPEARLAELLQGLKVAGEVPLVERTKEGSIVLTIQITPKVSDYLDSQRLSLPVVDGKASLRLARVGSAAK